MSIFLDKNSKVIVQGITGAEGSYHTGRMLAYGTNIVGGVTPGKGGQKTDARTCPVFNTVEEAVDATGATHTCIFVPPAVRGRRALRGLRGRHHASPSASPRAFRSTTCSRSSGRRRACGSSAPTAPGLISPGQVVDRHHAGPRLQRGQRRPDLPLGNPDLRGRRPADAGGPRPIHLRGHRRRPDHRHDLRRLPARVQERPPDRGDRRSAARSAARTKKTPRPSSPSTWPERPSSPSSAAATPRPGKSLGHAGRDHFGQLRDPGEQDYGLSERRGPGRRPALRHPARCSRSGWPPPSRFGRPLQALSAGLHNFKVR